MKPFSPFKLLKALLFFNQNTTNVLHGELHNDIFKRLEAFTSDLIFEWPEELMPNETSNEKNSGPFLFIKCVLLMGEFE